MASQVCGSYERQVAETLLRQKLKEIAALLRKLGRAVEAEPLEARAQAIRAKSH
jgi:hypothetical protein